MEIGRIATEDATTRHASAPLNDVTDADMMSTFRGAPMTPRHITVTYKCRTLVAAMVPWEIRVVVAGHNVRKDGSTGARREVRTYGFPGYSATDALEVAPQWVREFVDANHPAGQAGL